MAGDTSLPPGLYDLSSLKIYDGGSNSMTVALMGSLEWSEGPGDWVEATNGGHHASTPIAMKVKDGNCTISITAKATSFLGSSNVHLREAMLFLGAASAWTSTGLGTQKMFKLEATVSTAGATGGISQVLTWNYCIADGGGISIKSGEGELFELSASITALQQAPTVT